MCIYYQLFIFIEWMDSVTLSLFQWPLYHCSISHLDCQCQRTDQCMNDITVACNIENLRMQNGLTSLMIACANGHLSTVLQLLHSNECNVNIKNQVL